MVWKYSVGQPSPSSSLWAHVDPSKLDMNRWQIDELGAVEKKDEEEEEEEEEGKEEGQFQGSILPVVVRTPLSDLGGEIARRKEQKSF